jgi:hypothetical protein
MPTCKGRKGTETTRTTTAQDAVESSLKEITAKDDQPETFFT